MAEKSSWGQANIRQKHGLVWRNRNKISQIIKDYFYLPFFLLIILWRSHLNQNKKGGLVYHNLVHCSKTRNFLHFDSRNEIMIIYNEIMLIFVTRSETEFRPCFVPWTWFSVPSPHWLFDNSRDRICKRLLSPEIDSDGPIPPAYVARRAGTTNRVVVQARQAGNRFLGSFHKYGLCYIGWAEFISWNQFLKV